MPHVTLVLGLAACQRGLSVRFIIAATLVCVGRTQPITSDSSKGDG